MEQLFTQLGIDWHLLLSQGVNFLLLLVILRIFAYKPLLTLLHERRRKIEEGLVKAEEAEKRLYEVEEIGKEKIKEAETEAIGILKRTETYAKTLEAKMLAEARRKEAEELANMAALLRQKEEESRIAAREGAVAMVKMAIAKTVGLSPEKIDDALVAQAVKEASSRI